MNNDSRQRPRLLPAFVISILTAIFLAIMPGQTMAQGASRNPNQEILDRLAVLEGKIDALAAEQVTASFCISQGRETGLGADWIVTVDTEWEGGLGWAEVFSGEATAEVKVPAGVLPSETAFAVAASHGRNFDVCIDLPIELGPTDTALLAEIAQDINSRADDFPNRGKFQRRAHRLLNYTKRRVPGIQTRTFADFSTTGVVLADEPDGAEDEFDRVDDAVDAILSGGLTGDGTSFGVFRNENLRTMVSSFGELPNNITAMIDDPEQVWNPISNAVSRNGIDGMNCAGLGVDSVLRSQKPGLNTLCNRMEGLPSFENVENILSGELIGELFNALDTLTIANNATKVSNESRNRFCGTRIGQLPKFNDFCGR